MEEVQKYNKALAALVVPAVLTIVAAVLKHFGFELEETVANAVGVLLTAAVVYLVPNKQA
jgi:uncharacterized membrane protein YqjE